MKRLIALAALLPMPLLAQDDEISYDYFDIDYLLTTLDAPGPDFEGNGYATRLSVEIRDHLFLVGEYQAWDYDEGGTGSVSKTFGIGSNWSLSRRWSVYGTLGFGQLDIDVGAGNVDDDAGVLTGGARWAIGDGFELRFGGKYADYADTGVSDTTVFLGGDIYLTEVVTLSIEAHQNDDIVDVLVGLRFYFDKDSSRLRQQR